MKSGRRFAWILAAATLVPAPAAAQYDPGAVARIGSTYAGAHMALGAAVAVVAHLGPNAPTIEPKRWHFHFRTSVDDAVRDRVAATLAANDEAYKATERAIRDDQFAEQGTMMVRGYNMNENDLAEIIAVALAIASNVEGNRAATAAAVLAASRQLHVAMAYSGGAAALDDAGKQTIATELMYQMVYWQADWASTGFGYDAKALARLRASVNTSIAALGFEQGHWRLTDDGIVILAQR